MRLSNHFSVAELTRSSVADRLRLDNTPTNAEIANLRLLAHTLEAVRALLGGHPIYISSGFRSDAVNRVVGGAATSAHRLGLAADLTCPAFGSPLMVCQAIVDSSIDFDQLIHEKGQWVHLGLATGPMRRQTLTFSGSSYRSGLFPA